MVLYSVIWAWYFSFAAAAPDSYGSFSSDEISCQRPPTLLAIAVKDRVSGFNSSRISDFIISLVYLTVVVEHA